MPPAKSARDLQIVDAVLTNLARAYKPQGLVYDQVFPKLSVNVDSGLYPVFDTFFDDDVDNEVKDRSETPEVDFSWSTESYLCIDKRLKASITRKEENQAAHTGVLRLRQNKLETVLTRMALARERKAAAKLRNTANGGQLTGGTHVPATKWDAATGTNIEGDIKQGAIAARRKVGMRTNAMVIPYEVAYAVAVAEEIREIVKYSMQDPVSILRLGDRLLPTVLHGHEVIVAEGMRNTAKEGATKNLQDIWGESVRLIYLPSGGPNEQRGGWGIPSTGYRFENEPQVVDRWRENDPPVEYVRAWENADEKVCAPDLGYEIADVLT